MRLLGEFASVVDAVRCAVEVQREMAARNARVPAERRIDFRIGVNLGDIIIDENDIFGDGVNMAARLEALAEPAVEAQRNSQVKMTESEVPVQLGTIVGACKRAFSARIDALRNS